MAKFQYKTIPTLTEKAPPGIWHILANETAERFAYYGMSFILFTFMTEYLLGPGGTKMVMNSSDAKSYYHLFKAANYAFPIIGALLSDIWLGKFKTIVWFSALYCVGFLVMIVDQTRLGLFAGLFLIAFASGIIKPCVSANVGDQFGKQNKHLMTKIYNWFYFAINLGAFVGPVLTPLLLYSEDFGPRWAFGLTGVMMVFATVVFWIGRKRYVHAPAAGIGFVKECFSGEGLKSVLRLAGLYVFIAMFWALFEQTGSSWIEQAKKMDLHFFVDWKADQIPSSQALFVMVMIPIFAYFVYPAMGKLFKLTALRKIVIGMFVTASSFIIIVWIAYQLNGGFVEKITSVSKMAGFAPINLVDNRPDSFWLSDGEPNESIPQQILIQLRENKQWDISSVEILLAPQLSKKEVSAIFKEQKKKINKAQSKIEDANSVDDIINITRKTFTEICDSIRLLNYASYHPGDISVYIGRIEDANIPKLVSELKDEEERLQLKLEKYEKKKGKEKKIEKLNEDIKELTEKIDDYDSYLSSLGFNYAGDISVDPNKQQYTLKFDAAALTHVLLSIKSDFGAGKVRLAEVKALTDTPLPADFDKKDVNIWPNVAAVGFQPNIGWHFLGNIILTAAELLVSVTSLEFMYSQAPVQMKSFIMSIYLLAISLGNVYASLYNQFIKGTRFESGPNYFILWIFIMLGATVIVVIGSAFYREKVHMQDEEAQKTESQ